MQKKEKGGKYLMKIKERKSKQTYKQRKENGFRSEFYGLSFFYRLLTKFLGSLICSTLAEPQSEPLHVKHTVEASSPRTIVIGSLSP